MKRLIVFLLFYLLHTSNVFAADFSIGREGEILRPLEPAKVKLQQELITIDLDEKKARFELKTYVKNVGPSIEMFVGYPAEEIDTLQKTTQTFHDFITSIDGKSVPIMETNSENEEVVPENPNYNKWFLWPIILNTGQVKEITNVFWTDNKYDSMGNAVTGFILKPAKFWYSKPDIIVLRYNFHNFEPYAINSAFPANYHFEGDSLVFTFKNQIPTTDIKIAFNPDYEYQMTGLPLDEIEEFWNYKNTQKYAEGLKFIDIFSKNNLINKEAKSALLVQKAVLLFELRDYKKSEALFKDAISKNVALSAAYYHLAEIYAQQKNTQTLQELHILAMKNKINPIVLRKIESFLSRDKTVYLPEFITINPTDISRFTAEVYDQNADIQKISLQVFSRDNDIKKIISERDINLSGQAYRYYINENIKLPINVENAYCSLIVYDGSGEKVEKTLPLSNRKNKLLTSNKDKNSNSLSILLVSFAFLAITLRFFYKKIFR